MDRSRNQDKDGKHWHVIGKLTKAFNGVDKVLEEREIINGLRDLADKEYQSVVAEILQAPTDVPNWEQNIAMLIGAARVHRSYRDIFTIKEK